MSGAKSGTTLEGGGYRGKTEGERKGFHSKRRALAKHIIALARQQGQDQEDKVWAGGPKTEAAHSISDGGALFLSADAAAACEAPHHSPPRLSVSRAPSN